MYWKKETRILLGSEAVMPVVPTVTPLPTAPAPPEGTVPPGSVWKSVARCPTPGPEDTSTGDMSHVSVSKTTRSPVIIINIRFYETMTTSEELTVSQIYQNFHL